MSEYGEHFIREIEIKNYKLFKDFKAEGFGRVNLIGGKNNVGKTAFMEACLLGKSNSDENYIKSLITIEMNRNSIDFLINWINDYTFFEIKYKNSIFNINNNLVSVELNCTYGKQQGGKTFLEQKEANELIRIGWATPCNADKTTTYIRNLDDSYLKSFYKKGEPPLINNSNFLSFGNTFNGYLVNFIDEVKLLNREDDLNKALNDFFDIKKIDIIKNKVMLKKESEYFLLSEFGEGVKHFLNIILALYLNKDNILYLDEIENGIHYTNLDKLWEIILTISKEQNVQVFVTTHSKECIESYARVAKKLEDEEITYIQLKRMEDNSIKAGVYDSEVFINAIEQDHEVRGW